jgi:hypothetical protein
MNSNWCTLLHQEPDPDECCNQGCETCVWTVYWEEQRQYQREAAKVLGVRFGGYQGAAEALDPFEALELRLAQERLGRKGGGNGGEAECDT